jgi:DNA-binding NarL/FixJ family response regulator
MAGRSGVYMEKQFKRADVADLSATLTKRQQQIVGLVCEGRSNRAIAQHLKLSEGTVKIHLHTIYNKLGIESRSALMVACGNRSPEK